jgi:hypothetical protein
MKLKSSAMLSNNLDKVPIINGKVSNLNIVYTTELGLLYAGFSSFNHLLDFLNPNLAK